jgi:hypothetical protein
LLDEADDAYDDDEYDDDRHSSPYKDDPDIEEGRDPPRDIPEYAMRKHDPDDGQTFDSDTELFNEHIRRIEAVAHTPGGKRGADYMFRQQNAMRQGAKGKSANDEPPPFSGRPRPGGRMDAMGRDEKTGRVAFRGVLPMEGDGKPKFDSFGRRIGVYGKPMLLTKPQRRQLALDAKAAGRSHTNFFDRFPDAKRIGRV